MENLQIKKQVSWVKNINPSTGVEFYTPLEGSTTLLNTTVGLAITASYALNAGNTVDTGSLLTTASFASPRLTFTKGDGTNFFLSLDTLVANSASFALTSSFVNTLNQNVLISGSLTLGTSSIGPNENNITLGARDASSEGGQIGFNAPGGTYTSASFIDNYQNQFRILKGTNAGSVSGVMVTDLQTNNTQFFGAVTASAYSGLPNAWLYANRSGNQTIGSGTWASRDIIFNQYSSNNFTYNQSTGVATLLAGKTYRVTARLAWAAAGLYILKFGIYNQTTGFYTGPTVELIQSPNGTYNVSDNTLDFIFAVGASNTDISIRTTSDTNALTGEYIRGDLNTQLIIQQMI